MRTRPTAQLASTVTALKSGPTKNPEPVGELSPIGDGNERPRPEHNAAPLQLVARNGYGTVAAINNEPYTGEERRKVDRRLGQMPTTLDTRKGGLDRRVAGRISVKV